jgi:beta-xylosidase
MLAGTVAAIALLAAAAPAGAVSVTPAYPGDLPDPSVLVVGTTYWAYSTGSGGRNLQVVSSPDLAAWTAPTDPLPTLPSWARAGFTWAPGVVQRGGLYLMYYTVRDAASGRQCVSVASSPGPGGPFTDSSSGALVCQLTNGGSIDPSTLMTSTGTYLLWKSDDNATGHLTHLWSQKLGADGRSLVGPRALLLNQDRAWQAPVIEGPSMVAAGGAYYLFYGAGAWDSGGAAIGYARCTSPLGPCVNASVTGPWMASHGTAVGPSGPAVFSDVGGSTRLAYHAWTGGVGYQTGGVRALWIDGLRFIGGRPVAT